MNFFGYRETHLGYAAPALASFVKRSNLLVKKGRRMGGVDPDSPFARYFEVLLRTGWTLCLADPVEGFASIAATLMARGVERVWLDEAEIDIGDSLIAKIEDGMKLSRFIAVMLSTKSIGAPWVKKEFDVAMNREIASGEVVVLPLLYEECELPEFLKGKLYADFSKPEEYKAVLAKLLRRLRIA